MIAQIGRRLPITKEAIVTRCGSLRHGMFDGSVVVLVKTYVLQKLGKRARPSNTTRKATYVEGLGEVVEPL